MTVKQFRMFNPRPVVVRDPVFEHFCAKGHPPSDARILAYYTRLRAVEEMRRANEPKRIFQELRKSMDRALAW